MLRPSALLAVLVLVGGCASPVVLNARVSEAQAALASATARGVAQDAPVAFEEAREAVSRAENARLRKEDPVTVDHLGYLALQRVRIAEETARLSRAGRDVEAARQERQQVQLEARTAEAEAAQRRAERAQADAERQRAQAEAARRDAEAAQRSAAQERAEAARQRAEAEAAQQRAEQALRRAQELAAQVDDLQARLTNRGLVLTLGDVLFDTAQASLKPGGLSAVERLVAFLNDYPQRIVLVEGFTDEVGSEASNLRLSERRAAAVQAALLERGIAAGRIRTRGYGEAFPVASNATAAGRQQNRRVEVVISDDGGAIPERTQ